jgi:hypothetical protein
LYVVTRENAAWDGWKVMAETINEDQINMVKFTEKEDPGYEAVLGDIQRHVARAQPENRALEK